MEYLKKHGATYFPYKWANVRYIWKIKIGFDHEREPYVIHNGDKLFVNPHQYLQLVFEQNEHSAHRYIGVGAAVKWPEKGSVFVDVGAAEGIIGLDCIKKGVKEVYLIEKQDEWLKKLRKTFQKFNNVHYICKYASDHDEDNLISLDTLLRDVKEPILIKIDVEGMEREVLDGAKELLKRKDVKLVIATYHKPHDNQFLETYIRDFGFKTEFSEGYFAAMWKNAEPPYLRKGVLRAWKE